MGRMVLTVLGMVAEMEFGFIRDRQRAGIDAAKAKGIYKGRPATFDRARIVSLRKGRNGRHGDRQGCRMQARECLQDAQGRRAELSHFRSSLVDHRLLAIRRSHAIRTDVFFWPQNEIPPPPP